MSAELIDKLIVHEGVFSQITPTYLAVLAILDIFLPVEEPVRDFVLAWVLHNGHDPFNLPEKVRVLS